MSFEDTVELQKVKTTTARQRFRLVIFLANSLGFLFLISGVFTEEWSAFAGAFICFGWALAKEAMMLYKDLRIPVKEGAHRK
jgi:hypothetical protein